MVSKDDVKEYILGATDESLRELKEAIDKELAKRHPPYRPSDFNKWSLTDQHDWESGANMSR